MRHLLNVSILSHFLTSKIYGSYTPNATTRYDDKKKTHPAEINRQQKKLRFLKIGMRYISTPTITWIVKIADRFGF